MVRTRPLPCDPGRRPPRRARRSGIATAWLLTAVPVVMFLLMVVVDVGNVWVARVELENSLEAAALGAARTWREAGSPGSNWTDAARTRGQQLAAANAVRGQPLVLASNKGTFSAVTNPNENANAMTGSLILGRVDVPVNQFQTDVAPGCATPAFGVRAQATVPVSSLFANTFGATMSPYQISGETLAISQCGGPTRLLRLTP